MLLSLAESLDKTNHDAVRMLACLTCYHVLTNTFISMLESFLFIRFSLVYLQEKKEGSCIHISTRSSWLPIRVVASENSLLWFKGSVSKQLSNYFSPKHSHKNLRSYFQKYLFVVTFTLSEKKLTFLSVWTHKHRDCHLHFKIKNNPSQNAKN